MCICESEGMCVSVPIGCGLCTFCAFLVGSNHREGSTTDSSSEGARAEDGKFVGHGGGEPETER